VRCRTRFRIEPSPPPRAPGREPAAGQSRGGIVLWWKTVRKTRFIFTCLVARCCLVRIEVRGRSTLNIVPLGAGDLLGPKSAVVLGLDLEFDLTRDEGSTVVLVRPRVPPFKSSMGVRWTVGRRTTSPSARDRKPGAWTSVWCTKTSSPPSLGVMKPKPFFESHHLTVPLSESAAASHLMWSRGLGFNGAVQSAFELTFHAGIGWSASPASSSEERQERDEG